MRIIYLVSLCLGFVVLTVLSSCKDKVICAAFQSTFILDDSLRLEHYSLFAPDSLPKVSPKVRKNKFGIAKKDPMWVKNYRLKSAPMENVLKPEPIPVEDTVERDFHEEYLAVDEEDSIGGSSDVASADEDRYYYGYKRDDAFNRDMEYYVKYFGSLMPDNRPDKPVKEKPVLDSLLANVDQDSVGVVNETEKAGKKRVGKKKDKKKKEKKSKRKDKFAQDEASEDEFFDEDFESEDNDELFDEDEIPSLDDTSAE